MVKIFLGIKIDKLSAYPVVLLNGKLVIAICVNSVTFVKDPEGYGKGTLLTTENVDLAGD